MRVASVGCALLLLAALVQPAVAQEGWPWSLSFPSVHKKAPKRAQPAAPANPTATALLDPQLAPKPGTSEPQPGVDGATANVHATWQWRILRTAWTERDEK